MNDQLDNIIRYLDNEMSETERIAFESLIRNDAVLAKEVEFQRGLHGFLDRNMPELERKLSDLGDEFILNSTKKKTIFPYLIGLLILISLIFIGYFVFFSQKGKTSVIENDVSDIEIKDTAVIETIKEELQNTITEPIEEIKKPTKKVPNQKPKKIIDQPIASLDKTVFERNSILEEVLAETYRTNGNKAVTTVSIPQQDAVFQHTATIPFVVAGSTDVEPNYRLIVYSNRDFDITNDYRVLDVEMNTLENEAPFNFRFNGNLSLDKGLYYLVIRKNNTRQIIHISRFTVE